MKKNEMKLSYMSQAVHDWLTDKRK